MVLCLLYVFAPLAEYAIINVMQQYYTKVVVNALKFYPFDVIKYFVKQEEEEKEKEKEKEKKRMTLTLTR